MNEFTKLIIASSLVGVLSITGCGSESAPQAQDSSAHSEDDAHDHDHAADDDGHDGHDHAADDDGHDGHDHAADDDGHDGHDHAADDDGHGAHAATRSLGSVVIAGTTLEVSAGGELDPGAELNVNIKHIDGPVPAAVRFWIGNEAGDGAMRSKADSSDGDYHGHGEVPAIINAETSLWIEIETSNGDRVRGSVPLS